MLKKLQEKIFKKPIIKIALIFVILLLIGGGLYIIQKKSDQQTESSAQTEAPQQEKVSEPTNNSTINNETADWKVYQNKDLGTEFKYPSEWGDVKLIETREISKDQQFQATFSSNGNLFFGGNAENYIPEGGGASFYDFYYYAQDKNNSYKIVFSKSYNKFYTVSSTNKFVPSEGIEAIIVSDQEISQLFSKSDYLSYVNLLGNTTLFKGLAFRYRNIPKDQEAVFDKMISSIRFIK